MLNFMPRAQVPRKAGAKLQQFHEMNKSFAKFYLIMMHFRLNPTDYRTDKGAQAVRSHSISSEERWGARASKTR